MSTPPTLNYQSPPHKDDRPFSIAAFGSGLITGFFTTTASFAVIAIVLNFVNAPHAFIFAIAITGAALFNIWVGKHMEESSMLRGYFGGVVSSLPLMALTCVSCIASRWLGN